MENLENKESIEIITKETLEININKNNENEELKKELNEQFKLSYEQESYLKQQLLKYSVQDEVKIYFSNSQNVTETLFLKFLFGQLTSIPLLTSKQQAKIRFQQLIDRLPHIIIQSQIATKQETNDQFRKFVVKCFDIALRTPQEKQKDKTLKVFKDYNKEEWERLQKYKPDKIVKLKQQDTLEDIEDEKEEEKRKNNIYDVERDETIVRLQRRLTEVTQVIVMNIEERNKEGGSSTNGIGYLFGTILQTKNVKDLPPDLSEFIQIMIKILSLWMEREMRDPKQVTKLKRLYMITPITAIKASLNIANPVTLLKGMILMFLAKPFGARNLMQTICSVMVEAAKTERTAKKAHKKAEQDLSDLKHAVRKQVLAKIKGFAYNSHHVSDAAGSPILQFKEIPSAISILQYQWPGSPSLDASILQQLNEEQFKSLFEYAKLEKRKKEKEDFVEILGNEEMIEIIRELLPVLYEPLGKLFCKANIGNHFERLARVIKKLIVAAETGNLVGEDEVDDFELSGDEITDDQFVNGGGSNSSSKSNSINNSASNSFNNGTPSDTFVIPPQTEEKKGLLSKSLGWFKSKTTSTTNTNAKASTQPSTPIKIGIESTSPINDSGHIDSGEFSIDSPSDSPIIVTSTTTSTTTTTTTTTPTVVVSPNPKESSMFTKFTSDISDFLGTNTDNQKEKSKNIKKKFKKDRKQAITMAERLVLFEEVNTTLMERIYELIHELVVADAKIQFDSPVFHSADSSSSNPVSPIPNGENSDQKSTSEQQPPQQETEQKTGLLSLSLCWLLGLLQFLKDEEVDVSKQIFDPLSPNLKKLIIAELDSVIQYREWRMEVGNKEATKKNIEKDEKNKKNKNDKKDSEPEQKESEKEKDNKEEQEEEEEEFDLEKEKKEKRPVLEYLPTLVGPFLSLISERLGRLGDPSKYSLRNISTDIGEIKLDDPDTIKTN
ncbi:hypothetical protein DDB_G0288161 [Dictyostelium discoideum AX4]|uniref:PX domain-containing protein n=1 Tax=Dictyostelium discoideum TaxID=44689 RepID=Q54JB8_DICDI|nr:hypothetical protein DDB_G0288161 [Dictyostelium discoideum AX4]EAL63368.1 hypothetical protein DDB_G0288161 [Dictyostelium discoideum AX4]|eukprot:XP_636875.1 hypothetical protein DDB_G0288161 [Dictyostelium discoideum AX4]